METCSNTNASSSIPRWSKVKTILQSLLFNLEACQLKCAVQPWTGSLVVLSKQQYDNRSPGLGSGPSKPQPHSAQIYLLSLKRSIHHENNCFKKSWRRLKANQDFTANKRILWLVVAAIAFKLAKLKQRKASFLFFILNVYAWKTQKTQKQHLFKRL